MKLHHLRGVVAIAERGGLRAASRHLQLAQPALTRSLGEIERELGAPLFDRHARGMTLTATGQAFVHRASAILNEVRRAREEVEQLRGGMGGSIARRCPSPRTSPCCPRRWRRSGRATLRSSSG